jgi:hypothetical protein
MLSKSDIKSSRASFEFDTDGAFDEEEGEINDDIEIVRAKTVVELCQAHSADPKSCNGDCNSLHVCRFYILSSCEMTNCKFGHILDNLWIFLQERPQNVRVHKSMVH